MVHIKQAFPVLLCLCSLISPVSPFHFANSANFTKCSNQSTPGQPTGYLTLQDCLRDCGAGFNQWPNADILARFSMWLVPALVLAGNYLYAPLRWKNTAVLTVRHLGDPIGCLWAMLLRWETQARLRRRAAELLRDGEGSPQRLFRDEHQRWPARQRVAGYACRETLGGERAADLAVIWSAYDEFGYVKDDQLVLDLGGLRLSDDEWAQIGATAHRLRRERSDASAPVGFAVLSYVGAIAGAFIRTYRERDNNQTAHTIAIVFLLSYFVPFVLMSERIGVFRTTNEPATELREIHDYFAKDPICRRMFPELKYGELWDKPEQRQNTLGNDMSPLAWSGMNSSWRPSSRIVGSWTKPSKEKSGPSNPKQMGSLCGSYLHDQSPNQLLLHSLICIIVGCYFPASVLSWFSGTIGFGCRCLAWTLTLLAWIVSLSLDAIFKKMTSSSSLLWHMVIAKDAAMALYVIGTILSVQIGYLNSCWCRSNRLTEKGQAIVHLIQWNDAEWVRNWTVWPSVSGSCFFVMIFFGYLIHVLEFDSRWKSWFPLKLKKAVFVKDNARKEKRGKEIQDRE